MHYNFKSIILANNVWLNKNGKPIYLKLYESLKASIVAGHLMANLKLPPTRIIAKDLDISRSTVLKAYELLLIEKYISSKTGSGYFVNYKNTIQTKTIPESRNLVYPKISNTSKLFLKHKYLSTDNFSKKNIAFRPGLPPLDIFPVTKWKNLTNDYWQNVKPSHLSYAPADGIESFKIEIANYLRVYRSIICDHKQIIIVSGSLHSLSLIGKTIINPKDEVAMENPTFPRAYNLFKSLKANVLPCDVDNQGMQVSSIKKSNPKLIYSTPSNQYPLGVKMSLERRKELLHIASKKGALIIEDDYDHEFSNWENPLPSVFSMDNENRVIYLGTFNKLMHPSLRLAYMIVPSYLIDPIKAYYEQSSRFISPDKQVIMREFIKSDNLNSHLRSVLKISALRRDIFCKLAGDHFSFKESNLGLQIIGKPKQKINDKKIFRELLKKNVIAYPLSNYYIKQTNKNGLVFGFSSVNKTIMKEKIKIINTLF